MQGSGWRLPLPPVLLSWRRMQQRASPRAARWLNLFDCSRAQRPATASNVRTLTPPHLQLHPGLIILRAAPEDALEQPHTATATAAPTGPATAAERLAAQQLRRGVKHSLKL